MTRRGAEALSAQDYATAEHCFKLAMMELEKLGSTDEHGLITVGLLNLANVYQSQNKLKEAEPLLNRTLNILLQKKGPQHPMFLYALQQLCNLYEEEGDMPAAENMYQWSLEIFESQLPPNHPLLAMPLNKMAAFYRRTGRETDAETTEARVKALEGRETNWKFFNDEGSRAYFNGEFDLAGNLFLKALSIVEGLPQYHQSQEFALILHNLSSVCKKKKQHHQALSYGLRALEIYDRLYKKDDPNLSAPLNNLLEVYQSLGEEKEVKKYLGRIKKLKKKR